jgi:exosortase A-associated hydrolase 2
LSSFSLSAVFTGSPGDRLLVVSHRPLERARGGVLLIPPFAEEMNKSRRMLTLVARGLAARGFVAVLPDLFGTGDSDGEFAQCDWARWREDLARIRSLLEEQGIRVTAIVAVRTGCTLASEVAAKNGWHLGRSVFWQPVLDGERFLTQFLRLRVAAGLMGSERETVNDLRSRLGAGETLEVAGYDVSPQLAAQLAATKLGATLCAELGSIHWIEVVRGEDGAVSKASGAAIEEARRKQIAIATSVVRGEPFWSSTEIVENLALIERTVEFLAA